MAVKLNFGQGTILEHVGAQKGKTKSKENEGLYKEAVANIGVAVDLKIADFAVNYFSNSKASVSEILAANTVD